MLPAALADGKKPCLWWFRRRTCAGDLLQLALCPLLRSLQDFPVIASWLWKATESVDAAAVVCAVQDFGTQVLCQECGLLASWNKRQMHSEGDAGSATPQRRQRACHCDFPL